MAETLTPSLEDYLETILQLCEENGTAKISEIARRLNIAKPSATQAVASLRREGFVFQNPYGPISLTPKGREQAQEVWRRHQIISSFLRDVLKVPPVIAEKDACMIEHVISPETVSCIAGWLAQKQPDDVIPSSPVPMDTLLPGQKARIVKIKGKSSPIRRRLLDMGLVQGIEFEVERVAPLGDPIEIRVQDYRLSLRRQEAALMLVDLIPD